jgi:hypothetical protein
MPWLLFINQGDAFYEPKDWGTSAQAGRRARVQIPNPVLFFF